MRLRHLLVAVLVAVVSSGSLPCSPRQRLAAQASAIARASCAGLVLLPVLPVGAASSLALEQAADSDAAADAALREFLQPSSTQTRAQDAAAFMNQIQAAREPLSDEFAIAFDAREPLGLTLEERSFQGFPTTVVKAITSTQLQEAHPELRVGAIVCGVNGEAVDGKGLRRVGDIVAGVRLAVTAADTTSSTGSSSGGAAESSVSIRFRDPSRFFELLDSTEGPPRTLVTTSYLPANARDAGAAEQIITVERLQLPPPEQRRRPAVYLDVMEIQYVCQLLADASGTSTSSGGSGSSRSSDSSDSSDSSSSISGTPRIVDSSAERAPPGTSAQSIYYVLGQQNGPPGRFPPGWDLTLRGMVVGEKRRITLPYTLALERRGDKERGIPPFATLVYTVKLKSLT